jgi:hypothetical protein
VYGSWQFEEREFVSKAADSLEDETVRYPLFNDSLSSGMSNPYAFGELWVG